MRCWPTSKANKNTFYNTGVAQAQRIDVTDDRVIVHLRRRIERRARTARAEPGVARERGAAARRHGGCRCVRAAGRCRCAAGGGRRAPGLESHRDGEAARMQRDLKAEAMSSSAVQAMLDVFPAEIRDVEEM